MQTLSEGDEGFEREGDGGGGSCAAPRSASDNDGRHRRCLPYSTANPSINKAQPKFKPKMTEKFTKAEIIKFTCDAHPWMLGWLVVSDHPYVAVTDEKGAFKRHDIPSAPIQRIAHKAMTRKG